MLYYEAGRKMKKIKYFGLAAVILFMAMMVSSCKSSGNSISSGSTAAGAKVEIDSAKAVEKTIPAAEGGQLSLDTSEGGKMKVIFPEEALGQDSSLVMAPVSSTPFDGNGLLVKGFSLEEKATGKGPPMKSPAILIFSLRSAVAPEASIIKYREDGSGYDVIPSKVITNNGKSMVTASVSSFSKYGLKLLKDQEKDRSGKQPEDFNWVIYVKDKNSYTYGGMKRSITIDLKAVNTSGNITGQYKGTLSALATNDMEALGGTITAPIKSSDPNLSFTVDYPLASLVPPDDDGDLAPLTTENQDPDFYASGKITTTSQGTGTVSIGGASASKDISDSSSVPFEMYFFGPRVRMVMKSSPWTMYFDGYIRGEGK